MANINVKGFMMLAVGLIVSTILVTGVLVPVIGDAIEGDETTYTNTGEYYYSQAKEGENHTIVITNNTTKATITYDGEVLKEIPMGDDYWFIPLFSFIVDDEKKLCILEYIVGTGMEVPPTNDKMLDIPYTGGPVGWGDSGEMTISITGTQVTVSEEGGDEPTPYTVDIYLSKTGEYVWADDPIINPSEPIYAMGGKGELTIDGNTRKFAYAAVGCYGLIDEMKTLLEDSILVKDCMTFNGSNWQAVLPGSYAPGPENIVSDPQITEIGELDKINGINIETLWQDDSSYDIDVQRFIVPVTVGIEGSGGLSPSMTAVLSLVPFLIIIGITLVTIDHMIKKE